MRPPPPPRSILRRVLRGDEYHSMNDVFVHISAVERSGMTSLSEGQKVSFEIVADRRTGKSAAEQLRDI